MAEIDLGIRTESASVNPLFVDRWSPRSFNKNFELTEKEIYSIFGAARWAPSCFNEQPWRFKVALKKSAKFDDFLHLLDESNQVWAQNASAICFIIGKKKFHKNGKENGTFAFDCGSAWMSIALQACMLELHAHGMAGIKHEEIEKYFGLDLEQEKLICGFVLGKRAAPGDLPEELAKREKLTDRKTIEEIVDFL